MRSHPSALFGIFFGSIRTGQKQVFADCGRNLPRVGRRRCRRLGVDAVEDGLGRLDDLRPLELHRSGHELVLGRPRLARQPNGGGRLRHAGAWARGRSGGESAGTEQSLGIAGARRMATTPPITKTLRISYASTRSVRVSEAVSHKKQSATFNDTCIGVRTSNAWILPLHAAFTLLVTSASTVGSSHCGDESKGGGGGGRGACEQKNNMHGGREARTEKRESVCDALGRE